MKQFKYQMLKMVVLSCSLLIGCSDREEIARMEQGIEALGSKMESLNSDPITPWEDVIDDTEIRPSEPPIVEEPPVIEEPPVVVQPPVTEEPPVVVQPPVIEEPPVVVQPPVIEEPPVVVQPPVTEEPPVVVQPPVIVKPPKKVKPPVAVVPAPAPSLPAPRPSAKRAIISGLPTCSRVDIDCGNTNYQGNNHVTEASRGTGSWIRFDQKIQIADASKITLCGVPSGFCVNMAAAYTNGYYLYGLDGYRKKHNTYWTFSVKPGAVKNAAGIRNTEGFSFSFRIDD